ncbi:hypothetical protein KGR20_21120 [Cytobacillus oceanisediminis]|uniref:hypothetical protein n=1 Tax=Cytobacillus oceanisediminis TaxID=665099 RepID=UPI001CCDA25B|nr:hypothetical protein [Cytobacillus oceanisediminis]MBZ9536668.1 hypothetical protein [Cytobacillus oceanisediminis]
MNIKIKGYSKLTEPQQELFILTHNRHMKSMGADNQKKYSLKQLKKISWDRKENCLKVYYDDIWWKYLSNGNWC